MHRGTGRAYLEFEPTSTLYHYTSVRGFAGMLGSKEFWLSDLRTANDPRELNIGLDLVKQAITAFIADEPEATIYTEHSLMRLTRYIENATFFVCCFSLNDDKMPMWNTYGDNHAGVCVGFRPTAINILPVRVSKVKYIQDDTVEGIKNIMHALYDDFIGRAENGSMNEHDMLIELIERTTKLLSVIVSSKHETWSYENEVRIVFAQTSSDVGWPVAEYPDGALMPWSAPLIRRSEFGEVKYMNFPFGRLRYKKIDPSRAIEKVTIGHKCAETVTDVEKMLKDEGFTDVVVERSACEVR